TLELASEDERALSVLELVAVQRKDAAELALVDRTRLECTSSAELRSLYRTRLGEFLEASNPEQALAMQRPALIDDPENVGAACGVTRLAEQLGRVELLLEAAETQSRVVPGSRRVSFLFRRAATL